jgi:hypothetical protein
MNCEVTAAAAGTAVRDAFVDLICQDDDLVRAEFDALVAASWHTPPGPPPPAPPRRPPPGAAPPATPVVDGGRLPAGRAPARRHGRRQRSPPPPAHALHRHRDAAKGG